MGKLRKIILSSVVKILFHLQKNGCTVFSGTVNNFEALLICNSQFKEVIP